MVAYISVSFSKRKFLKDEFNTLNETLNEFQITPFVFVDHYNFNNDQEKEMMEQAVNDIDNCQILIAEVSEKGIGIGVEVGYAKALGKTIIYMRNTNSEHSTTVSGISDYQIVYKDLNDLKNQLKRVLQKIINSKI